MRYQKPEHAKISIEDYAHLEADVHDDDYSGKTPFNLGRLMFTPEEVWRQNHHAYKRGTYNRGWRKRRLFQLMDLSSLKGKHVLDWACGLGQHSTLFAMHGARVDGFDLSPVGIKQAKAIAEANGVADLCEFQVANAADLPYADDTFDIVFCNAVLHHAIKYPGIAEETRRVLKPGGKIFIAEGVRENEVYRAMRRLKHAIRPQVNLGDVDLEVDDLVRFLDGYEDIYIEQFSLIEKFVTQQIGGHYETRWPVLAVYFLAKKLDDLLYALFPRTRKWSLEVVMTATKAGA